MATWTPNITHYLWFYIERTEDSFVGASQKDPPPLRLHQRSPELPLLGPQNSAAITPLDMARFQSRTVRSVVRRLREGEEEQADVATPGQEVAKGALQKDSSLHLDTPSRFLSRDRLFGPSFNTKVSWKLNGIWFKVQKTSFALFTVKTNNLKIRKFSWIPKFTSERIYTHICSSRVSWMTEKKSVQCSAICWRRCCAFHMQKG